MESHNNEQHPQNNESSGVECCEEDHDELSLPHGGAQQGGSSVGESLLLGGSSTGGSSIAASIPIGGGACATDFASNLSGHQHQGNFVSEELEKNLDDTSNFLEYESEEFQKRMWSCFQNCARSVTQVYMRSKLPSPSPPPPTVSSNAGVESTSSHSQSLSSNSNNHLQQKKLLEEAFKAAAQHSTSLFKDSIETSRRLVDLAIKTGANRRTKEMLSFIKSKKKRFIKKEELISFLIGGSFNSSNNCGGKKDVSGQTSGVRTKHVHFAPGFTTIGGGCPNSNSGGGATASFESPFSFGNSGVPVQTYQVHQTTLHHQNPQFSSNLGGAFSLQSQPHSQTQPNAQQVPNVPQRDIPSASTPTFNQNSSSTNPTTPSISSPYNNPTSNTSREISSNNESQFPSSPQVDPTFLHLAVQQLFVAGGTALAPAISSQFSPQNTHHQIAGVKRPAPSDRKGDSFPGGNGEALNIDNSEGEGIADEEDDSMMEDSVDGDSSFGFKRMRFY